MQKTGIRLNRFLYCLLLSAATATSVRAMAQDDNPMTLGTDIGSWTGDLDGMVERRIIRVLVPYSKILYFVDLGGRQRGISYDVMHAFEEHVNKRFVKGKLRVHIVMIPTPRDQLLPALIAGEGDVVAANLTVTEDRQRIVDFTAPLARAVREVIVTGPGSLPLATLDDLAGKNIFVSPASSYRQSLLALNREFVDRGLPPMTLRDMPGHFETEDVLEMTNIGHAPIAVADSYLADLWKQVYRKIQVREDLVVHADGDIAFAVRKNSPKLVKELNAFIKTHRKGTTFGNLTLQKYLEETKWIRNVNSPAEQARFDSLVDLFQKYGGEYRIDWLLLAAQGYQESQFDQQRRSPAGAIGIMQVMPDTGAQMRVGDITKLEPNIHAGAKYDRHLIDEYFDDSTIDELNRALFAFAAYNAGPSRVRDLRHEAKRQKLNPDVWFNNVERIAALRIGRETVQYVSNIYKYYFAYTQASENVVRDLMKPPPQQGPQPKRPGKPSAR